jgi:[ribosomal protein S5]-alanine N-acetyltransferase
LRWTFDVVGRETSRFCLTIMILGLLAKSATPELIGARVILRRPSWRHYKQWARLREESRVFLQPWEPSWSDDELTRGAFNARCKRARKDAQAGVGFVFLIFDKQTNALAGGITLGNIRYGVARFGQIGYWMGEAFAGKGMMQDALRTLMVFGFERLNLHRLEAACIPSNIRSQKVLLKCGFSQEGLLKSYLKINGSWQDHLLFAHISGVTD